MHGSDHRSVLAVLLLAASLSAGVGSRAGAGETQLNGFRFTLPDGFQIEQVAGPGLVERPICADFDEQGRLYIGDSSGSNEDVKIQLEKQPHRIVRLEDTDGDGRFDKSVVFADGMMFPEGTLWHQGSLYVGAPPHIWKLTDTTGDGRADRREVWFDGKTLTHCGNDMHGPYLGPDGWFYWCKGAFAEQEYQREDGRKWQTRAAHIFRRHPGGGPIEAVMTGGMDNPVEVVFTPGGERIFTTTFLAHPVGRERDGIIHAIYGGVYGKVHRVLDGHPRTGPIMPVLAYHEGASAPCGLARLETSELGAEYQNNLLACSFNLHKIIRHELFPQDGSFRTHDSDFLVCDSFDFHPTDVIEDADGSLLVIDTGGWYKMCCPTSQLAKPDILGGIYRIRRTGAHQVADPRGSKIPWTTISNRDLAALLADHRFAVRNRATRMLGHRDDAAIDALRQVLATSSNPVQRLQAVWALARNQRDAARAAVRFALRDEDQTVRQAALHAISIHRDAGANGELRRILKDDHPANRRVAAEALGRLRDPSAVTDLLTATADVTERVLGHSLIYAVIETGQADPVRALLRDERPSVRSAALIAADQIPAAEIGYADVGMLLDSPDHLLNDTAWWIADHHPEWAGDLANYFGRQLESNSTNATDWQVIARRLARFAQAAPIQQLMGARLDNRKTSAAARDAIVRAMRDSGLNQVPQPWVHPLKMQLESPDAFALASAVAAVHTLSRANAAPDFVEHLRAVAARTEAPVEVRLQALAAIPRASRRFNADRIAFLCNLLSVEQPVAVRALAVDVLVGTALSEDHLRTVADAVKTTGPMELRRLLEMFARSRDEATGARLVDALAAAPAAVSLPVDLLREQLAGFGDPVVRRAEPLFAAIERENSEKLSQLSAVAKLVAGGDVRRGQKVFFDTKAACLSCHSMGYVGGSVGPTLTRIGNIRTERDLLESILFPSASFVRSFEPTSIVTTDGKTYHGVVKDETEAEVELQVDAVKVVRIAKRDIEVRQPGKISVMPAGLDKHFTPQQLADLIVFLKAAR